VTNILKPEQIALVAAKAGFKGQNLILAVAVALAESGGNALDIGDTQLDPYGSYGLWQINSHAWPELIGLPADPSKWYDPWINATFAYKVSGGTNWKPWSVYIHETYKNKMPAAQAGVAIFLSNPTGITLPSIIEPNSVPAKPILKENSTGPYVKLLQATINRAGYSPILKVDGEFGPKTLAGVKWFQKKVGIKVDGIVGPITWSKLELI
jgi:hypothetical protein